MNTFFVSTRGADTNSGTKDAPFFSIQAAIEAARNVKGAVTVTVEEGEYHPGHLQLDSRDDGLLLQANGHVVINGGISLSASDFEELDKEEKARLHGDAVQHTRKVDLKRKGLTPADWGTLCAIGGFNTASHYDGAVLEPMWCELFVNNVRQTVARYPNEGFLHTTATVRVGENRPKVTAATHGNFAKWEALRNPQSDIFGIDADTARRAGGWKTLDDVWMFGYPMYTWADTSSPVVAIDSDRGTMETAYVSLYGVRDEAPYYFYNVFEELDAPGEWYLDRQNGILYYYPAVPLTESTIQLSLATAPLLSARGITDLTVRGLHFMGTRGNALELTGNRITVEQCEITNAALWGIVAEGTAVQVQDCEIHHTGQGGVKLFGGDRDTLTPSGNRVTNNHFHHNAEIFKTGSPSVWIGGVGSVVSHNCIHDLAHQAVLYAGNEHVIEYNEIYAVCQYADDAGAVYSGRDYTNCGNVVRYNYFHDIKSRAASHQGTFAVYSDDNNGSSTVWGNIMHRCQSAVLFHGGHDLTFKNNLIIESTSHSDASVLVTKYAYCQSLKDGGQHLTALARVAWDSPLWRERYPHIGEYLTWDPQTEQNCPHYIDLSNNLIVDHNPIRITGFDITDPKLKAHYTDNVVTDRASLGIPAGDTLDLRHFDASALLPVFEALPFEHMGLLPK